MNRTLNHEPECKHENENRWLRMSTRTRYVATAVALIVITAIIVAMGLLGSNTPTDTSKPIFTAWPLPDFSAQLNALPDSGTAKVQICLAGPAGSYSQILTPMGAYALAAPLQNYPVGSWVIARYHKNPHGLVVVDDYPQYTSFHRAAMPLIMISCAIPQ